MKIKLNCDMGEGFGIWKMGLDEEIMPHIDLANLACGFHASDPLIMVNSVALAKRHNVTIGAHPAYPDLVGFGRRNMVCSLDEINAFILYQISALDGICKTQDTHIEYVKPHGALYHDMMNSEPIFETIIKTIKSYNPNLKLMIFSNLKNDFYTNIAGKYGIKLLFEVFADRNYTNEGDLINRIEKNALIEDENVIVERLKYLKRHQTILSVHNKKLSIKADTICVHSDSKNAVEFIKRIKPLL